MDAALPEGFSLLLRDTIAEMAARDGAVPPPDPIERLGLETQQAILAMHGAPLPPGGYHGYTSPPSLPPDPDSRTLDVRH